MNWNNVRWGKNILKLLSTGPIRAAKAGQQTLICTLWVPVYLNLNRQQGPSLPISLKSDIADSGEELSYRHVKLHKLAGRYDNPMPDSATFPSQGLRICLQISFVSPFWRQGWFTYVYHYIRMEWTQRKLAPLSHITPNPSTCPPGPSSDLHTEQDTDQFAFLLLLNPERVLRQNVASHNVYVT